MYVRWKNYFNKYLSLTEISIQVITKITDNYRDVHMSYKNFKKYGASYIYLVFLQNFIVLQASHI